MGKVASLFHQTVPRRPFRRVHLLALAFVCSIPVLRAMDGGRPASLGEWPAVFFLQIYDRQPEGTYAYDCTGTLIHPKVILTAGHCVSGNASTDFILNGISKAQVNRYVVEHGNAPSSAGFTHLGGRGIPYPKFRERGTIDQTIGYDLGVILLDSPITEIAPLRAWSLASSAQTAGRAATFLGYGVDSPGAIGSKRIGTGRATAYKDFPFILGTSLSSPRGQEGDSGSPVIVVRDGQPTLVGVLSGTHPRFPGQPNLFAGFRSEIRLWIEKVAGVRLATEGGP